MFDGYQVVYNFSAVMDSKSGKAVISVANALFLPWATETDIKTRRYQATIKCEAANLWGKIVPDNDISCQGNPCLFNIEADPCERNNVAKLYPAITTQLYEILKFYRTSLIPQINKPVDVFRANPKLWNNTWSTWIS